MRIKLYRYTCDFCGKQEVIEDLKDISILHPDGWATVKNSDYPGDDKMFHFSSYACYTSFNQEHPDAIESNASIYADNEWFT